MTKYFPKVLMFGHPFNDTTGMGITLTNLFTDWPADRIAIMAPSIDIKLCNKIRPCCKYWGKEQVKRSLQPSLAGGTLNKIRSYLKNFYQKTGLLDYRDVKKAIDCYHNEVREYKPEIVFCSLGTLYAMRKCEYLMSRLPDSKLVLYIVDDWVDSLFNERFFPKLWRRIYDRHFRSLLNLSAGRLSICQKMSDVYLERYGKVFYPFHNPVDVDLWNQIHAMPKYPEDITSILYVGKINADTFSCLQDMSKTVKTLNKDGKRFQFDIYSPDCHKSKYLFENYKDTEVLPAIPHEKVPEVMKSYSSLFLTLGFSKHSRKYVRLSMPTKLTEYLACSKIILLYCPSDIALAEYLADKECALICNDNHPNSLAKIVTKLSEKELCTRLISNANLLAKEHDIPVVRERFRQTMNSFMID